MPVIVDITKVGNTKALQKTLITLKSKTSAAVLKNAMNRIPHTKLASPNTLYTSMLKDGMDTTPQVANPEDEPIKDVAAVSIRKRGKQVGTMAGKFSTPRGVVNAFTSSKTNYVLLSFPSINSGKAIVIRPKPRDLIARRDGRTANTWNIGLSDSAVTKYRKQLENTIHRTVVNQINNVIGTGQGRGIAISVAAKLGVAADSITVFGSDTGITGQSISAQVRREVASRMQATGTGPGDTKLTNRSGKFVRSITAQVKNRNLINYSFDKEYAIHEKRLGTTTRIKPKTADGVLAFDNKKTGKRQFAKYVDIKSRPVIRESIRTVALKLFEKKFRLGRPRLT